MKKKVYLSGKITGLSYENAFENFARAELKWKNDGYEVVNPMTIEHNHLKSWVDFMRVDLKAMLDCTEIYMLNNWESSKGAVIEHNLAVELMFIVSYQKKE